MSIALFNYVTRVRFGYGAIQVLPEELSFQGVTRFLLITDEGVVRAGLAASVIDVIAPAAIFDQTPSNPTESAALEALSLFNEKQCEGIVALGGGSCIDLAKAVALLATHEGRLQDYVLKGTRADSIGAIKPIIAIPTTAGTGAEVGRAASITLENGHKAACVSLNLIPKAAICDPELTLTLPPSLTASTGMDALCHGIETCFSSSFNPPAEAIALDVIRRAVTYLPTAVLEGTDRHARHEMLLAAVMGGLVLQKGLGAVHALTHPLGALGHHHGTLNSIVMPAVLAINERIAPDKATLIKSAIGLDSQVSLSEWAQTFAHRLGLPTKLSSLGISQSGFAEIAAQAETEHLNKTNPRPLVAAEFLAILEASY